MKFEKFNSQNLYPIKNTLNEKQQFFFLIICYKYSSSFSKYNLFLTHIEEDTYFFWGGGQNDGYRNKHAAKYFCHSFINNFATFEIAWNKNVICNRIDI